ncbi:hypothetical protein [Vallitalea okinawensis]|uniref:hypothetical protein n=1 Tax=Vallitalea okinawensis TaxID=2078660 RepID=UPI000CFCE482|nr:hypothetical protein [Vallitalea okinawensis]
MEELKKVNQNLTTVNRNINKLLSAIIVITIPIIVINYTLLILIAVILTIYVFLSSYKVGYIIKKYVQENHFDEFKEFQRANYFIGMSNQRYSLFLKSKFFNLNNVDEGTIIINYEIYKKRVYIMITTSFLLIIAVMIIKFI